MTARFLAGTAVFEFGAGRPVLLLHGGFGSHVTWRPLVGAAGSGVRFLLPDSPGHGESDPLDGPLTYPAIADRIAAVITELGLDHPVVGGWSDGGQIALELAVRHPGLAGALVIGGASADFDRGGIREKHRMLLGADARNRPDLAWLDYCLGPEGEAMRAWHPGGRPQWDALVLGTANMWLSYAGLSAEQLATVEVPALVLGADGDELVGPELAVELFRALPRGELAVIPGADHEAIRSTAGAPRFMGPLRDFLERLP
ncbi:alpha/beta fold hydrolase [Sciscionella sediminilitoris]|uniref:alpha/beta fold hydrolase n=1 Tax=Sciscionella sediminilitoris TaxID=1445613 RepID=UPI0004DECE81|nr:alpha/beta hydrolase [Sciscionella sp. SE31]